jgi:hypothetical protein
MVHGLFDENIDKPVKFRFIEPTDTGGLPIDSYVVEFKESSQSWQDARRRMWQASKSLKSSFNKFA